MKAKVKKHPYFSCWVIFAICATARLFEYYVIRTDETIIAENFLHKLFGVGILFIVLKILEMKPKGIGFVRTNINNIGKGLLLGLCCFLISYSVEITIHLLQGKILSLGFYATGFSLDGLEIRQSGFGFILLCILFNLINVFMEEGIFRGLFLKLAESVSGFMKANLFTAFLFGVWHWVMPMRSFTDGESSLANLFVMGVGYIILAGIMSIKWSMLFKLTGSLWVGLGDHLFNNVIVTNLVHIITDGEADSLQIVRILIAQLLSFIIVTIMYKKQVYPEMKFQ